MVTDYFYFEELQRVQRQVLSDVTSELLQSLLATKHKDRVEDLPIILELGCSVTEFNTTSFYKNLSESRDNQFNLTSLLEN